MLLKFFLIITLMLNSTTFLVQASMSQENFFKKIENLNVPAIANAMKEALDKNPSDFSYFNDCSLTLAYEYGCSRIPYNHAVADYLLQQKNCDPNIEGGKPLRNALMAYHTKYAQEFAELLFTNGAHIIQDTETIKNKKSVAHLSIFLRIVITKTSGIFLPKDEEGMLNVLCSNGNAQMHQLYPDYANHWNIKSKTQPETMDTFINQINNLHKHYNLYSSNFLNTINEFAKNQKQELPQDLSVALELAQLANKANKDICSQTFVRFVLRNRAARLLPYIQKLEAILAVYGNGATFPMQ